MWLFITICCCCCCCCCHSCCCCYCCYYHYYNILMPPTIVVKNRNATNTYTHMLWNRQTDRQTDTRISILNKWIQCFINTLKPASNNNNNNTKWFCIILQKHTQADSHKYYFESQIKSEPQNTIKKQHKENNVARIMILLPQYPTHNSTESYLRGIRYKKLAITLLSFAFLPKYLHFINKNASLCLFLKNVAPS